MITKLDKMFTIDFIITTRSTRSIYLKEGGGKKIGGNPYVQHMFKTLLRVVILYYTI